jgi:Arc/MetJ-type ribon-helix-helix transcriptional regulator
MPEWATISIREELIEEIRRLMKTSGRYRSISEFVSESIRLRLEEMSHNAQAAQDASLDAPSVSNIPLSQVSLTTTHAAGGPRGYINIQLQRAEQIWWVLVRLFGDLGRKDTKLDAEHARQLRNARTMINFIRSHACPECDIELANERLPDLQHILEEAKRDLVAAALGVPGYYTQEWITELDKAERGELRDTPSSGLKFMPGLPRDNDVGWTRVTLSKPVPKERVEEISKTFGVLVKPENSLHFVVRGDKKTVKKAVEMLYELQSN